MAEAATLDIEDAEALCAYLRRTGRLEPDERPDVRVLAGGVSNRTVLLTRPGGEAWVLKQALARLRVPVEWLSDPARIQREALGLRVLAQIAPPGTITALLFEDEREHLLAMRAVPQPHANWKSLLLAGNLQQAHVEQFGALLGVIHRAGYERRAEMAPLFEERAHFESLRLEPYCSYTATQVPAAATFLEALVAATRAYRVTIVHGDYSPKNILIHRGRLVLLDHEVIHFGDPGFDLGFSLAHLLSKAHHLRERRAAFAAAALCYWSSYRRALGALPWAADLEPRAVRHTLGCLLARVAGRSQLEYLDDGERARQRAAVVPLMEAPPAIVAGLVECFVRGLDERET